MKNTTNIGNIGYSKVLSKFIELEIPVYTPFAEGYIADLIADFGGKLNKIQIKTTKNLYKNSIIWKLTRQEGFHGNRKLYTENEIDYFALYCIESDTLCLIPFSETNKKSSIAFRLDNYEGRKLKTMNFVSDYKFENIINRS